MTINPASFAEDMAELWRNKLGLVVTAKLKQSWAQAAKAFNSQIEGRNYGLTVLQPPTGSGKTKSLELYCSKLPMEDHPGVLIVTKMKPEADKIAENINALAGAYVAASHHEDNADRFDQGGLDHFPVLVITHAAYLIWLTADMPPYKHGIWNGGVRKLTVIDEALDIIDVQQIDLDEVYASYHQIPEYIRDKNQNEISRINLILDKMNEKKRSINSKHEWIEPEDWRLGQSDINLRQTSRSVGALMLDHIWLDKNDFHDRQQMQAKIKDTLKAVVDLPKQACLYARKGYCHTFTKAKVIVPRDKLRAVMLDATASCNPIYGLLGDAATVIQPPKGIRSYGNVKLYASFNHKVGKMALTGLALTEAEKALGELAAVVKKTTKIFVCCHKNVQQHIGGYDGLPPYSVAHWGAIDGKNDWRECSTAFFYGLPYLDNAVPEVMLRAVEDWRGEQCPDDEREEAVNDIAEGHLITSLVQAINRVQCRNIVDEAGNCPETEIYLLLPERKKAERLLNAIKTEMPGIQVLDWKSSAARRKIRRSKYEHALLTYLETAQVGKHTAFELKNQLQIPDTSFERLVKKAKDTESELHRELKAIRVEFYSYGDGQGGRGRHSWFEKFPTD